MKRRLWIRVMMSGFAFIIINACSSTDPKPVVPEFDYYPQTNVYYDKTNNTFIYSLDSGRTWNNYVPSSDKDPGTMGKKVALQTNEVEVWKDNAEHRLQHGGAILNISNKDAAGGPGGVSERVVKKPASKARKTNNTDKKEKKSVKEFFENLFKKKKDKGAQ